MQRGWRRSSRGDKPFGIGMDWRRAIDPPSETAIKIVGMARMGEGKCWGRH